MASRSSATWKIVIGLAIVCGVLVFAGGFLHRRALEKSVVDAQDASAQYVKTKLTHQVEGVDLSKPLRDAEASSLAKEVDPPGDDGVRIFAPNGTAVFTEGVNAFGADGDALQTAKSGRVSRVIDGSALRVYAPIESKNGRVLAVAAVVSNYTQMRKQASGPLDAYRLPLVGLGVLLLIIGVVLMLQATRGPAPLKAKAAAVVAPPRPSKSKVTGFDEPGGAPIDPAVAVPQSAKPLESAVYEASASLLGATIETEPEPKQRFRLGKRAPEKTAPDESPTAPKEKRSVFSRRSTPAEAAAPVPADASASASALQREVAIREALEDQLEQLRTQVKTQKDERVTATRELTEQLEEATRRAEEAEARLEPGGASGGQAERVATLEQELAQAKLAAAQAAASAEELQRAAAATPAADQRVAELTSQLTDAQQRASSAEQRAASVESVRDELEVRVAQLGSKATDLEQRAADLESRLQEANAGGDAVREEIASLTSALSGANARIKELESVPASPAIDHEASEAEITRLRGELAKQLERAQAAEDRISTLEADVLAAANGVSALPIEHEAVQHSDEPIRDEERAEPREVAPPAPAGVDRYDDVWSTPYSPPEPTKPTRIETELVEAGSSLADRYEPQPEEPDQPQPSIEREPDAMAEQAASTGHEETEGEGDLSTDDMWSLRARLADAAARKKRHLDVD